MQDPFAQDSFEAFTDWPGSDEEPLAREIEILQSYPGGPPGYRMRRIILINYWLYDEMIFDIPHGRIFLAGDNTAGKSTVLTAAMPLALEGSLRPNRLDTFGEQYKSIEYYVLGSEISSAPYEYEARTSYIVLEFEWCDPDNPPFEDELQRQWLSGEREKTRFLTIGLGLFGKIDRKTHILVSYFVITDGSRIGDRISLIDERRPLSQAALRQLLREHGHVCEKQGEYEQLVSRYLFGFKDIERFHDLIDLLLILRQPNLSSELTLSKVYEYLSLSLPAIPTEVTRRVINTINEIEAINRQLQRLRSEREATGELHLAQQNLILSNARRAARDHLEALQAVKNARSTFSRMQNHLSKAEKEQQDAHDHREELRDELQKVRGAKQVIDVSGFADRASLLETVYEQLRDAEALEEQRRNDISKLDSKISTQKDTSHREERRFRDGREACKMSLDELQRKASQEAFWATLAFECETCADQIMDLTLDAVPSEETIQRIATNLVGIDVDNQQAWLRELEELHSKYHHLEDAIKQVRETEQFRREEFDLALRNFQGGKEELDSAMAEAERILEPLSRAYSALIPALHPMLPPQLPIQMLYSSFDEHAIDGLVEYYTSFFTAYQQIIATCDQCLVSALQQVEEQIKRLDKQLDQSQQQLLQLQEILDQKQAEPEYRPKPIPHRAIARSKLAEQAIQAYPLYVLIDFAPHLDREGGIAGHIEYLLEDVGLLDALVVLPSDLIRAKGLLAEEGLSDCLLMTEEQPTDALAQDDKGGYVSHLLQFDTTLDTIATVNQCEWQAVVSQILLQVSRTITISSSVPATGDDPLLGSAEWGYGVLTGHTGKGQASVIGKETRLLVRKREIAELERQLTWLQNIIYDLMPEIDAYRLQQTQLEHHLDQVRTLLTRTSLYTIMAQLQAQADALKSTWKYFRTARDILQSKQQERQRLMKQLGEKSNNVADLATNYQRVRSAITSTTEIISALSNSRSIVEGLRSAHMGYHEAIRMLRATVEEKSEMEKLLTDAHGRTIMATAKVQELERPSQDEEELLRRKAALEEREGELENAIKEVEIELRASELKIQQYKDSLSTAETVLKDCENSMVIKQKRLANVLSSYPVPQFEPLLSLLERGASDDIPPQLLLDLPREESLTIWAERLDQEQRICLGQLADRFHQHKRTLYEYGPELSEENDRIIFKRMGNIHPLALLESMDDQIQTQEVLLEAEEGKLFENFLLQDMAEIIHTHIFRAQDWIHTLNTTLQSMFIAGDRYDLQWRANTVLDLTKLGSHLAQRQGLLRKPIQTLTDEERELVRTAFREEIRTLRQKQQAEEGMNFEEALRKIFDYRDWYHFEIYITPRGGKRLLLDNKVLGGRSGAEKLFALYVPLFAALSSLYDSAAKGAPRLLALDEAFDKASANNMQRIIEFLAAQDFQWIMTSPQINLSGANIPVSIRYLMLHEKGSQVATAISSRTWQSKLSYSNDVRENNVEG